MRRKEEQSQQMSEEVYDAKERRASARFYAIFLSVLMLFLLFLNFWSHSFSFVFVQGHSMDKTLQTGEYLLAMKVIHPEYELQRGDIIVVGVSHYPEWKEHNKEHVGQTHFIIKRLIGMEGDIVRCTEGNMEICYAGTWDELMNPEDYPFVALDEPYAYYDEKEGGKKAACNTFEYTVGEGEIFFLGDNRNHSADSRYLEGAAVENLDRLYKITDVTAIVPDWALKRQKGLQKCLVDIPAKIKNFLLKPFRKLKK